MSKNKDYYYYYQTDERTNVKGEYGYLQIFHEVDEGKKAYCSLFRPWELRAKGIFNYEEFPHIKDAPIIDKLLYVLYMEGSEFECWSTYLCDEAVEEILEVCKEELERRSKEPNDTTSEKQEEKQEETDSHIIENKPYNGHTRTLIFDSYVDIDNEDYEPRYRFETDDEVEERIAKAKLGKHMRKRGDSWKERIIVEMNEHNDSWDQIEKIEVKIAEEEQKHYENDKHVDPNKIKEQFGIEWYDVLQKINFWDPTDIWVFQIWTKNRVYFSNFIYSQMKYDVISGPRNPSDEV